MKIDGIRSNKDIKAYHKSKEVKDRFIDTQDKVSIRNNPQNHDILRKKV